MRRAIVGILLATAFMAFSSVAAAEELTVNSILTAQKSGVPADRIVAMVNNKANTIGLVTGDLATLRTAGLSEDVISAIAARIPPAPAPAPAPAASVPLMPDDARLVDLVRLVKSGISESIIAGQVKQSGKAYKLSVNDLLYLKENGVMESIIAALMATASAPPAPETTGPPQPPKELVFEGMTMKSGLLRKNRPGRLVMSGDTFAWVDSLDPRHNLEFKISGLEKVWLTCRARTPENFCYQVNFRVVKGDRFSFEDLDQASGSNAAILKVMDALRTYFPRTTFAPPDVD